MNEIKMVESFLDCNSEYFESIGLFFSKIGGLIWVYWLLDIFVLKNVFFCGERVYYT